MPSQKNLMNLKYVGVQYMKYVKKNIAHSRKSLDDFFFHLKNNVKFNFNKSLLKRIRKNSVTSNVCF